MVASEAAGRICRIAAQIFGSSIGAIPALRGKVGIPSLRRAILGLRKFPVCAEHIDAFGVTSHIVNNA